MARNITRFLSIQALLVVILLAPACKPPDPKPIVVCAVSIVGTIVAFFTAPEVEVPLAVTSGTAVVAQCVDAVGDIVASITAPDNSAQVFNIYAAKQVISKITLPPINIPNCKSNVPFKEANFTIQESIQTFVEVGTQSFIARPDDARIDFSSVIARSLVDKYAIPIGHNLLGSVTFPADIPAGKTLVVTLTGSLLSQIGSADIEQNSKVIVPLFAWRYPTALQFDSQSAQLQLTGC